LVGPRLPTVLIMGGGVCVCTNLHICLNLPPQKILQNQKQKISQSRDLQVELEQQGAGFHSFLYTICTCVC
jgi:hypothetical protein